MKRIIYYFSGTGNSLQTARILAGKIGGAQLVAMRSGVQPPPVPEAEAVGFVCPVYEWDVPEVVKAFVERLELRPEAYYFMVATYIAIHGRCFETVDRALRAKGCRLDYARALRCVASQCIAYEPFPPAKWMVPRSERKAARIGAELAARKRRPCPRMSPLARALYPKMMVPFLNVEREFDKGFFTSERCTGCGVCRRVCPCGNITLEAGRPVWHHRCLGCDACVAYCPTKAIQFKTPEAYVQLNNPVSRRLGLPEHRTRYHHPAVSAADLMKETEQVPAQAEP